MRLPAKLPGESGKQKRAVFRRMAAEREKKSARACKRFMERGNGVVLTQKEQFLQEMAEKHLQEEALREEQQKLGLNSSPDKIDMALDASLS